MDIKSLKAQSQMEHAESIMDTWPLYIVQTGKHNYIGVDLNDALQLYRESEDSSVVVNIRRIG